MDQSSHNTDWCLRDKEQGPRPLPRPSYPTSSLSRGWDLQGTMMKSTSSGRAAKVLVYKEWGTHGKNWGFRFFKKWNYKLGLEAKWSCFHINNTTYSILSTKQEQVTYNDICHWRRNYSKDINVATEVYKNFQIFLIKVGKKLYESRKKTKGTAF